MKTNTEWFLANLQERFLRYAVIDTMSDRHADVMPSTPGQWDLLRLLEKELSALGITDIYMDPLGYLIARIPANKAGIKAPTIGFMAHVDTSSDMSGKAVKPQIHKNYTGTQINLGNGYILDPEEYPALKKVKGHTLITASGDTLLGADDKAGIAEIMTAAEWLLSHPEIPHGDIELIFTPDEETGKGLKDFPVKKLNSLYCYTLDGDLEGIIETECFNAYVVHLHFKGRVIHLGSARGTLINAVNMAAGFINMLPRNESPEATDGRYGYYCPLEISGGPDSAVLDVYLRDFDLQEIFRRIEALKQFASAIEAAFPGGKVEVREEKQYLNMLEHMKKEPRGIEFLEQSVRMAGLEPEMHIIRGGTDGAKLSEMGIPTPNIFTGGDNYHSRFEWVSLNSMQKASEIILNLISLWAGTE